MSRLNERRLAVVGCAIGVLALICGAVIDAVTWFQGTLTASIGADLGILPVGLLMAYLGVLITIRRPGNRVGLLFCASAFLGGLIVLIDAYATRAVVTDPGSLPGGEESAWIATWLWVPLAVALFVCLPLIFPDGRFLSPQWRWAWRLVIAQMIVLSVGLAFEPGELDETPVDNPFGIESSLHVFAWLTSVGYLLFLVCIPLAAMSVVLRFRRSTGLERLQIKCGAVGAVGVAATFVLSGVLGLLGFEAVWSFTVPIAVSLVVLAAGLSVLRFRLYDLDRIVSRTLAYTGVTVVLGAAYVGLVLVGQTLFSSFAGGSNLAIAISTLVVAALFLPARARVQHFVDRRFYRRRYDAQRTLEAFGARLREQVDLGSFERDLQTVVAETMEPSHVTLWRNNAVQ